MSATSGNSKRLRVNRLGFDLAVTVYRECPMPGIDFELGTPWGTIGGYIHG